MCQSATRMIVNQSGTGRIPGCQVGFNRRLRRPLGTLLEVRRPRRAGEGGLDDGSSPLCPQCGQVTFGMEPVLPLVADDDAEALPDGEALQPGPSRLGASHHGRELLVGK